MAFLHNTWYVALWSQDLPVGETRARTILGEPLVFFRTPEGEVTALIDECPHRFAPLHKGRLLPGGRIQCPYHGLEFDGTGKCVRNPHGNGQIPASLQVKRYPVIQKHSLLWIWMGDKPADPALIPDFSVLDEDSPLPVSKRDWITMPSNYQLITDNLMDLSHVSFLHDGILGNEETVDAQIGMEQNGDTLAVTRFMPNVRVPGLFDLLFRRDGKPVDLWFKMRWDAPGCMLNDAGAMPVGGTKDQGTGIFGAHLLTPETETTTHYHFAAARQNPIPFPPDVADDVQRKLGELRRFAFEEQDEPMIHMQQRALLRTGGLDSRKPVLLSIDVGPVRCRRVLESRIASEKSSG